MANPLPNPSVKHPRDEETAVSVVPKRHKPRSHAEAKHIAEHGEGSRWKWGGRVILALKLPADLVNHVCEFLGIDLFEQRMWQLDSVATLGAMGWHTFFERSMDWATKRLPEFLIFTMDAPFRTCYVRLPNHLPKFPWDGFARLIANVYLNLRVYVSPALPPWQYGSVDIPHVDVTDAFIDRGVQSDWCHPYDIVQGRRTLIRQTFVPNFGVDIIRRMVPAIQFDTRPRRFLLGS